jgi:6-pyruvoyltetrahydropterin/6-carboxytetrahydropterin synthase
MMHLARQIRFSVDPFLDHDAPGSNGYASKPAGAGLSLFLQLTVELAGPVNPQTGFLLNVVDIDRAARDAAVPVIAERIRRDYRQGRHIGLAAVAEMLTAAWDSLDARFGSVRPSQLILNLNPFRTMAMKASKPGVVYFSEKFEFAAMHKLWNDAFSEDRNFAVFGKCANPAGHGHNYLVEVTVSSEQGGSSLEIGRFEAVVNSELIALVDHKNLNLDVAQLEGRIPTVENLAVFAWNRLAGKFDPARLHSVTVWESDRTYCTYRGENPTA